MVGQSLAMSTSFTLCSNVAESWSQSDTLMARAAKGKLVLTPNPSICREDVITNEEVISPVLKHLGVRTTVDAIHEHVEMFLSYARPKGKQNLPRPLPYIFFFGVNLLRTVVDPVHFLDA